MNNARLYEKIPNSPFSIKITKYENSRYTFSPHWHEHTELHLIIDGECTLNCNGETVPLKRGDCVAINGNELHGGETGNCTFLCILLSPEFFGHQYPFFKRNATGEIVDEILAKLSSLSEQSDLPAQLEAHGYVHLLLSYLLKNNTAYSMNRSVGSAYFKKREKINQALTYINDHYAKPISTARLAAEVYLSEGYFCQLFKEVMKKSAIEYLNTVRTEKARSLLLGTTMSVAEIADCCGFPDANYFSRTYKKLLGETPIQTRVGNTSN